MASATPSSFSLPCLPTNYETNSVLERKIHVCLWERAKQRTEENCNVMSKPSLLSPVPGSDVYIIPYHLQSQIKKGDLGPWSKTHRVHLQKMSQFPLTFDLVLSNWRIRSMSNTLWRCEKIALSLRLWTLIVPLSLWSASSAVLILHEDTSFSKIYDYLYILPLKFVRQVVVEAG